MNESIGNSVIARRTELCSECNETNSSHEIIITTERCHNTLVMLPARA
jgi:hypothetical protein